MKIYRVHYQSKEDSSMGYNFWTTRKNANNDLKEHIEQDPSDHFGEVDIVEFPYSKTGILEAMYIVGCHPNNG